MKDETAVTTGVQFHADNVALLDALPKPIPAYKAMPQWLKDMPHTPPGGDYGDETVKKCVPFLDVMNAGFIIPMWCDLIVTVSEDLQNVNLSNPPTWQGEKIISDHNAAQIAGSPFADWTFGHSPMKLNNPWVITTDPGVSCLFTAPFNQPNKVIHVLSAIVDTDAYYNNINFPFILTAEPGQHIIRKGTPIMQVVPFKRRSYSISYGVVDKEQRDKTLATLGTQFRDGYKQHFRHKKSESES